MNKAFDRPQEIFSSYLSISGGCSFGRAHNGPTSGLSITFHLTALPCAFEMSGFRLPLVSGQSGTPLPPLKVCMYTSSPNYGLPGVPLRRTLATPELGTAPDGSACLEAMLPATKSLSAGWYWVAVVCEPLADPETGYKAKASRVWNDVRDLHWRAVVSGTVADYDFPTIVFPLNVLAASSNGQAASLEHHDWLLLGRIP